MFFPSQSRGFLSIQIPLNAVFRTTGTSPRLLPFHLILWWACDLCFLLLPQTLFSSAPLLVDTPTPSPLSVGTLQIFTLSPPPFIFIVSILTNSSSPTVSATYNFFSSFCEFLLLTYLLWCYLAISTSLQMRLFLPVPRMLFSPFFVCSELYRPPCLAALLLPLISHSPFAFPSTHLLNQIILFHVTLASVSMTIYLHC